MTTVLMWRVESRSRFERGERGVALLAVLFALTLLMLLALPFSVSMTAGADAAAREVDSARAEQASASVRDLLIADAVLSHPPFDEDPEFDGLAELPDRVVLPEAMTQLQSNGRTTLGGSVEDLQRYLALDAASPLVLANVLGTAVRLAEPLEPDAGAMVVDQAESLPDEGFLWIGHEVIRYGSKEGNRLLELERALFQDQGFAKPTEPYPVRLLALDFRCVIAAAWPHLGRVSSVADRRPYAAVSELAEVGEFGIGQFSQPEIDKFEAALHVTTMAHRSATWGRPVRVFDTMQAGLSRSLRVKNAIHVGAGSTVRLRDMESGAVEYNVVMRSTNMQERTQRDLVLPSIFRLELLMPVSRTFAADTTVVEPLVPPPVNINTAPANVLMAVFEDNRRASDIRVHAGGRQQTQPPMPITRRTAKALVDEILSSRESDGPYRSWQDLCERLFVPRLDAANGFASKMQWVLLYRNLRTGRDAILEMGSAPVCFDSGPWIRFRAAASLKRSRLSADIAARHERVGIAAAVPGFQLDLDWRTQEQFENAFRLDRRAPFWLTTPVNLGSVPPNEAGVDPAGRHNPHLIAHAFPGIGLGAPRYASKDDVDAGMRPGPASTPAVTWARTIRGYESFALGLDPRGQDVSKDGPYLMQNTGPANRTGGAQQGGNRHQINFPFSADMGFMHPFAVKFWAEPQTLDSVTLFDHGDGDLERNRLALLGRDGNLVLEMLDEAGLDPNPSDSPAGVERTSLRVEVPLAEINLPADTPVHLAVSAQSGRPHDLSLHVDGVPRGKQQFVTYLTSPIDAFDPQAQITQNTFPPGAGNQRYLNIDVEDTDGFPPQGVLRIGTELFEYTAISGNTFQCQWLDSSGGRGARQIASEHRPDIPLDAEGNPSIDIDQLQGVNLDVYPSHPVGARVELYGYCNLLSPDSPMMVGETRLGSAVGGFAVARGFLTSPRPIQLQIQGMGPINIGSGLDENWAGDLELANPEPAQQGERRMPTDAAQEDIFNGFPETGGYALLLQRRWQFRANVQGQIAVSEPAGGIEVIRYGSRNGSRLVDVQRAQSVPGDDSRINSDIYDGTARKFITEYNIDWAWDRNADPVIYWNNVPGIILWVIPISLPVQDPRSLWDPQVTQLTEWVQLLPDGGDVDDTEWVRYDAILGNQHIARVNRAAWNWTYNGLVDVVGVTNVEVGPLGPSATPAGATTPPWPNVQATSDYIGYVPQLEANFPQIHRARARLAFRGDMMLDFRTGGSHRTSSHPHSNSIVMQCQRLDMRSWGNFGAFNGRPGRHDRVALIQGSAASGDSRPTVEWHTVNWAARRYRSDNLSNNRTPSELLGPWPFQLVAFKQGVRGLFTGPPQNRNQITDPRSFDRMVKFPSGELPAAYCAQVPVGAGIGNDSPIAGFVDEIEVVQHRLPQLVVDEAFTANAQTFLVRVYSSHTTTGMVTWTNDQTADYPRQGGLLEIDGEILAYSDLVNGQFTIATNGRGLLGTEQRDHDRGARVRLLTNRPVAILSGQAAARDNVFRVQGRGAMPSMGTFRLGNELAHYTWMRVQGDNVTLEMPRWYPEGQVGTSSLARGLFRGRFGTAPNSGSSGQPLIEWPFRYWDRHADRSDDPELAYAQLTHTSAPAFFRSISWREEVRDSTVDVVCRVRTNGRVPWTADPTTTPGLFEFTRNGEDDEPRIIGAQSSRIEVRFSTMYQPGALDLIGQQAHGWKTSARVSRVRVEYEGQTRIFDERVTTR